MNLIQQNKKRDEIINFLLERIENLEHALPAGAGTTIVTSTNPPIEPVVEDNGTAELDNLLASVQDDVPSSPNYSYNGIASNPRPNVCDNGTNVVALGCTINPHSMVDTPSQVVSDAGEKTELDDLLDEVNNIDTELEIPVHTVPLKLNFNDTVGTDVNGTVCTELLSQCKGTDKGELTANITSDITVKDPVVSTVMLGGFDDLEAEFSGLMETTPESVVHIDNQLDMEVDLVSSILGADDIANMADVEIDLSSIPKDKKRLISKYTTKQLKQISSKMALKTSGSKVELVDRIIAKLSAPDPEVS